MPGPSGDKRRTAIADAAIAILASDGARGLTHRAVDRHLGIPEGSTGSHYGTREALVEATVARIAERNLRGVREMDLTATSRAEAARRMVSLLEATLADRENRLARYALAVDAANHPRLREAFLAARDHTVDQATRLLREAGFERPERGALALLALFNGLALDRVMYAPDVLIEPAELADYVERLLSSY